MLKQSNDLGKLRLSVRAHQQFYDPPIFSHSAMIVFIVILVNTKRHELNCSRSTPSYFTLIGDKPPPAARYSNEVDRA